jgi:YD repeat-containing protein
MPIFETGWEPSVPLLDSETFAELMRDRDFIAANHSEPLNLERVASEACPSPFHFHRLYSRAFGETPHEFRTRFRLERAQRLLRSPGATLSSQSYTSDAASNVLTSTRDSEVVTYTYDTTGQLLSVSRPNYAASYTYDGNGNRLTRTVNGVTETYTVDAGDKLTSVTWSGGSKSYSYHAAGRIEACGGKPWQASKAGSRPKCGRRKN